MRKELLVTDKLQPREAEGWIKGRTQVLEKISHTK
jgi:hypothetical protein